MKIEFNQLFRYLGISNFGPDLHEVNLIEPALHAFPLHLVTLLTPDNQINSCEPNQGPTKVDPTLLHSEIDELIKPKELNITYQNMSSLPF